MHQLVDDHAPAVRRSCISWCMMNVSLWIG